MLLLHSAGCITSSHSDVCGGSIYSGTRFSRRCLCHGVSIAHITVLYSAQIYIVVSTSDVSKKEHDGKGRAEKPSVRIHLAISGHTSVYLLLDNQLISHFKLFLADFETISKSLASENQWTPRVQHSQIPRAVLNLQWTQLFQA